jgi:hypothetical protein
MMFMHKSSKKDQDFAFPYERLWSPFTFYLVGISALHSLRNDFGAKLCIPLGTTLELLHLLLRWYFMHPLRNDFGAKLCIPLEMNLELLHLLLR